MGCIPNHLFPLRTRGVDNPIHQFRKNWNCISNTILSLRMSKFWQHQIVFSLLTKGIRALVGTFNQFEFNPTFVYLHINICSLLCFEYYIFLPCIHDLHICIAISEGNRSEFSANFVCLHTNIYSLSCFRNI
jgi:hypothetical protein